MQLGVTIFLTDRSMRPDDLAKAAEERGFSSLWVPEHTHIPTSRATPAPMGEPLPEEYKRTLDPFVAMAMAAAVTTRLRVGTGIALPAQRDPIVTAKEVATIDHLSGGRFVFGIGYGWNVEELADHGVAKADRRAVVRERILAMQQLWSDGDGGFSGEHVTVSPSFAWPKPVQKPWPPVVLGGAAGPILFRHIAEFGDGWIPIGGSGLADSLAQLREACEAVGRDFSQLHIIPFGTLPDEGKLAHYASLGVTECVLRLPSAGADEVLPLLDDYARFL
jgi:probable F420-dependent oxidoreductase